MNAPGQSPSSPGLRMGVEYGPLLVFFAVNFLFPATLAMRLVASGTGFLSDLDRAGALVIAKVIVATTGQNALSQIEVFKEVAGVTGLVMTKLDGTARGGVLVAAAEKYGLPIHAIGVGEGMTDLRPFDANEVARIIAGVDAGARK